MNKTNIIKLIYEASENNSEYVLEQIISELSSAEPASLVELSPHLELLLDSWGESIAESYTKAMFCINLARIDFFSSYEPLRHFLVYAVKRLSPDVISKTEAILLSSARENLPLKIIADKTMKISFLSKNFSAYHFHSSEWLKKKHIDDVTHTVEAVRINDQVKRLIPLDAFINESVFFRFTPEELISKLSEISETPYSKWHSFLCDNALSELSPEEVRKISLSTFIPSKMTPQQFEQWLEGEKSTAAPNKKNNVGSAARNIQELLLQIKDFANQKTPLTADKLSQTAAIISKSLLNPSPSIITASIEVISIIYELCSDNELKEKFICEFREITEKLFPNEYENSSETAGIVSKMPSSILKSLAALIHDIKRKDFLAKFTALMPLKFITQAAPIIGEMLFIENIASGKNPINADIILWAWRQKNKKNNCGNLLHLENILSAISEKKPPKFRLASIRELKKMFSSNNDFIAKIADISLNEPEKIFAAIERDKSLTAQEKQSLLVKLSRIKPEFASLIEKEYEKGTLSISKELASSPKEQPKPASLKSYRAKVKELEDIINRQIPENSAAIAHARGYGDLRENAEYSAAKERQKFLNKRKNQLERELASVLATAFQGSTENGPFIKPGRKVDIIRRSDSAKLRYFVLGIWDSDPDRNMLSCESALAKAMLGKKKGDLFTFNGEEYIVEDVSALPEEILAELNDDEKK